MSLELSRADFLRIVTGGVLHKAAPRFTIPALVFQTQSSQAEKSALFDAPINPFLEDAIKRRTNRVGSYDPDLNSSRVNFIALGENLIYVGGFDYEYGYDDLFETFDLLFKKANIPFSWKALNDDSYEYEVDGIKYTLDFSGSDEEDNFEVGPDTFVEIESNINKGLEKRQLYLVHTHTGDQTADYVLVKRESVNKLREIFPHADDLQLITNNKVQDL